MRLIARTIPNLFDGHDNLCHGLKRATKQSQILALSAAHVRLLTVITVYMAMLAEIADMPGRHEASWHT
jgi:hypothetical protein